MPRHGTIQENREPNRTRLLAEPEGRAQLDKVKNVPSARSGPAALVALAVETSGDDGVIAAWESADQKRVLTELVKGSD